MERTTMSEIASCTLIQQDEHTRQTEKYLTMFKNILMSYRLRFFRKCWASAARMLICLLRKTRFALLVWGAVTKSRNSAL